MPDRIRNHVARSALMRKGGVHEKSRSSHRHSQKRQLKSAVDEYLNEIDMIDHSVESNQKVRHKKTATAFDGSGRFLLVTAQSPYSVSLSV